MSEIYSPVPQEAEKSIGPENTVTGKLGRWILKRYPVWPFVDLLSKKSVPVHRSSLWYVMGGIVLFFLLSQFITGILLMVYYRPSQPWQSVLRIVEDVPFGEIIRSVHHWGANFMILALFLHLFSTLLMKAYRPPREFTWITGLGLFALTMGFGFTGYLLPWDELAFFATKVGVNEAEKMPVMGPWIADLLRGGAEISDDTIGRFYLIHVVLLPLGVLALVLVHLLFIQLQGMSEPDRFRVLPAENKRYKKFFTHYLPREAAVWFVLAIILVAVAYYYPRELDSEANSFYPAPEGIKPEWYFLPNYQVLKLFPGSLEVLGAVMMAVAPLGLLVLPFVDKAIPSDRVGKVVTILMLFAIASFVGFGIWGYLS